MNESPVEERGNGVSRRDMIKGSVVAGGLVWAAPVLLSGKAAAQAAQSQELAPCCGDDGQAVTITVSAAGLVVAGGGTLLAGASLSFPAPPQELLNCLLDTEGGTSIAVELDGMGGIEIILTGVTLSALAVARVTGIMTNNLIAECPAFPTMGNVRVEVVGDVTTIVVTGLPTIVGLIELSICLPNELSPFCP